MNPIQIEDWRIYRRDGEQFLHTAFEAHRQKKKAFSADTLYNLTCMGIEKLIMAFLMSRGDLAENHTMTDLDRALQQHLGREVLVAAVRLHPVVEHCAIRAGEDVQQVADRAVADGVDGLAPLTDKLAEMGIKDIVLDSGSREIRQAFEDQVAIRRSALKDANRSVGFPTIAFPCEMAGNIDMETVIAAMYVAKYGGIVVLSDFTSESLFPLLLERLNIFTDPQRPMTVTEGIYEIGNPDENSPVLVTTNFALTYFIVSGEIEGSKVPAWLLIKDSEGLSVMTAWAAGKFDAERIAKSVNTNGLGDKISHQRIIIHLVNMIA